MIKRVLASQQDKCLEEWLTVGLPKLHWQSQGPEVEIGTYKHAGVTVRLEIDRGIGPEGQCRVRVSYDGFGTGRLATVNRQHEYSMMIRRDARYMAREVIPVARKALEPYFA